MIYKFVIHFSGGYCEYSPWEQKTWPRHWALAVRKLFRQEGGIVAVNPPEKELEA
jgi:hypothetical protein